MDWFVVLVYCGMNRILHKTACVQEMPHNYFVVSANLDSQMEILVEWTRLLLRHRCWSSLYAEMSSASQWVQLVASRLVVEPMLGIPHRQSPAGTCQTKKLDRQAQNIPINRWLIQPSNRRYDSIPWRKKTTLKLVPYDNLANYPWGAATPKARRGER